MGDTIGEAQASISITPGFLDLLGEDRTLHLAYVTIRPGIGDARVKTISNGITLTVK